MLKYVKLLVYNLDELDPMISGDTWNDEVNCI